MEKETKGKVFELKCFTDLTLARDSGVKVGKEMTLKKHQNERGKKRGCDQSYISENKKSKVT